MIHKCPYCLHPFTKNQATVKPIQGIDYFYCPNPNKNENDRDVCGKRLPLGFFEADSTTIAIVGPQNSGKTYYFIALAMELFFNQTLTELGIHTQMVGDETENKIFFKLLNDLKEGNKFAANIDNKYTVETVLEINIEKNNKKIYLSFFDNPGEKIFSMDYMIREFSNVINADGLIFLIEPSKLRAFRELIYENSQVNNSFSTAISNLTNLLIHAKNNSVNNLSSMFSGNVIGDIRDKAINLIKKQTKITKPIAITISKFDLIKNYVHSNVLMDEIEMQNYIIKNGQFDEFALNNVSTELESLIYSNSGDLSVMHTMNKYQHSAFFGVKSIKVDNNNNPLSLDPKSVSLPLLWVLKKLYKI